MNHLLLLIGIILLQQEVTSFQQQHISAVKRHATVITRKSTRVNMTKRQRQSGAPIPIQQKQIVTSSIFLSTAFGMCLIGGSLMTPQLSNAAAELSSDATTTTTLPGGGMSITNYARQVFGSPLVGSTPGTSANKPAQIIDPKYTTREERNRAYDEAFQQDARDRDAYYGQMAMRKRQEADQSVSQYRESLGLDGKGDTRMRVGEEKVEGMASLRDLKADYLSTTNDEDDSASSSTIPAE